MLVLLKEVVLSGGKVSGVYALQRKRHRDKAIVLTYHGVVPAVPAGPHGFEYRNFVTVAQFDRQIRFLLKHYRPLRAIDFIDPDRDIRNGFLITFDDGFLNNYQYAMPVLKKHGLQGCFFITTGLIGTRDFLWTEQVTLLLKRSRRRAITLELDRERVYHLDSTARRDRASCEIRRFLKRMPREKRVQAMEQMRRQLDDVSLTVGPQEAERYLFMTWEEVRGMIAADQYIGAHTHTHPMLSTLSEEESYQELAISKSLIEEATGKSCELMSYPNGEKVDYGMVQKQQLASLGYAAAFTQIPLFNTVPLTQRYDLHRVNIALKMSMALFEATLCGLKS